MNIGLLSPSCNRHITPHFKWKELLVSSNYPELIKQVSLNEQDQYNYFHLIATILEPERKQSNTCTIVNQGKRSDEMFEKMKKDGHNPSSSSQHFCTKLFDCAIDWHKEVYDSYRKIILSSSRVATLNAYNWISKNCPFGFGQLYYSEPKKDNEIGFVHIGSVTPNHQGESWKK